jgi:hypothetical protein
MKVICTVFLAILLVSCATESTKTSSQEAFVQDGIRIIPPVKNMYGEGVFEEVRVEGFFDGGTDCTTIIDAEGKSFDVYINRRIGSENKGAIYLNAYPGESNSVLVIDQAGFKQKIGNFE